MWNLEVIPAGGSPALVRTIKVFPAATKAPEVEVTGLQVHEAAWPRFSIAIGTSASHIHLLRGELGASRCMHAASSTHACLAADINAMRCMGYI